MHPVSMTSRPVRLFIAENGIDVDEQMVDLMVGEHYQAPFTSINPSRQILNDYWLGPDQPYLCGNQITIADYFGACLLTLGEVIRCDFSAHPDIERWLANMKRLRSWPKANEALYGFAEAVQDQKFVAI